MVYFSDANPLPISEQYGIMTLQLFLTKTVIHEKRSNLCGLVDSFYFVGQLRA